jgi:light-regulated signal transduction histidine kinase (bacteriophytochrome)
MPIVSCDKSMLRHVFVNLLSKPVKYARPRDPAMMEIGCTQKSAREWVAPVKGLGAGVGMDYGDKLFEVFQRLHFAKDLGPSLTSPSPARHSGGETA